VTPHPCHPVLRRVRQAALAGQGADLTDGVLLGRFLDRRDEAAFEELLRRHGPMVLGVCRRILGNAQDAEDAFQATFLVLVRKARTVVPREKVAAWLHGVACNVARKARLLAARRKAREEQVRPVGHPAPLPEDAIHDWQPLLDEELERLPDLYRLPIVLCELEGRSRAEAARQLGVPEGTLSSRLARGRKQLARRLARRGLTLSAGVLAVAVPPRLLAETARVARQAASGNALSGIVSAEVTTLTEGALKTMLCAKLRKALAIVLAGLLTVGLGAGLHQTLSARGAEGPEEKTPRASAGIPRPGLEEGPHTDRYGDPLPPGALVRLGTTRWRHGGPIWVLAFTPDGKRLASAGMDGVVRIWDVKSGKELRSWADPLGKEFTGGATIMSLAFAPGGKLLAIARLGAPPLLWDPVTDAKVRELGGPESRATRVAFAPDGKQVALTLRNRFNFGHEYLTLVDVATGKEVRRLKGPAARVRECAYSPDGRWLAGVFDNGSAFLWEAASGRQTRRLEGKHGGSLAWSPDGRTLATGAKEAICLWDPATGKQRKALPFPAGTEAPRLQPFPADTEAPRLRFTPDGKTLLALHQEGIRFWDLATGKASDPLRQTEGAWAFTLSPDGKVLATGGSTNRVHLWQVPGGKALNPPDTGLNESVNWVAFSPDGRTVATGGWGRRIQLWDASTGKLLRELAHSGVCLFHPDGKTLITGGVRDGTIRLWDLASGSERRSFPTGTRRIGSLAVSPDGRTLATSYQGIRLWDLDAGKLRQELGDPKTFVRQVAFTPDGKTLAALHSQDQRVQLYDVATGKPGRTFKLHDGGGSLALSPDGKLLAARDTTTDGLTRVIRLWDLATGQELRRLEGGGGPLDTLAFSPDSRTLLWGRQNTKVVRVWEVASGRQRRQLWGHQGDVRRIVFSPDGARAASASTDGSVLIWDIRGPLRARQREVRLKPAELETLWADLADPDASKAYQAMTRLARSPTPFVDRVRKELRPVRAAEPGQVERWLRDLNSDTFAVRERAREELGKLGPAAEPGLRKALAGKPSLEVRKQAERLLERLASPKVRLRRARVLELLEQLGTPEARRLLEALVGGAPGAEVTEEARAAVARLRQRDPGGRP
jgi:RNA polymerase sigma factor (sigma-70 family)